MDKEERKKNSKQNKSKIRFLLPRHFLNLTHVLNFCHRYNESRDHNHKTAPHGTIQRKNREASRVTDVQTYMYINIMVT